MIKPLLCVSIVLAVLSGCSSTASDVRRVVSQTDLRSAQGVTIALQAEGLQRTFQDSSEIFTLRSSSREVETLATGVIEYMGFQLSSTSQAAYILRLKQVSPDGGACNDLADSAELDISYSLSLLTFGVFPTTQVHCILAVVELYANFGTEPELMGEFFSDAGSVEIYGGARNIQNYQGLVRKEDEIKGIEQSLGSVLAEIIDEGAFTVYKRAF